MNISVEDAQGALDLVQEAQSRLRKAISASYAGNLLILWGGITTAGFTALHFLGGPRGGLILAKSEHGNKLRSEVFPGIQGGPLMHVIAAKAVSFKEAQSPEFVEYQKQVVKNAKAMAATFIERGINIVSGGTENHLMLVDLIGKPYTGKDADEALGLANITVNKNAVPNDPRSPFITSGLRVGTPAITTRGFGEAETVELTGWMCDVLESLENETSERVIDEVKHKVLEICARFPVYG